jgi:hypothetical protein
MHVWKKDEINEILKIDIKYLKEQLALVRFAADKIPS